MSQVWRTARACRLASRSSAASATTSAHWKPLRFWNARWRSRWGRYRDPYSRSSPRDPYAVTSRWGTTCADLESAVVMGPGLRGDEPTSGDDSELNCGDPN